jgi:hypothetical protein
MARVEPRQRGGGAVGGPRRRGGGASRGGEATRRAPGLVVLKVTDRRLVVDGRFSSTKSTCYTLV